MSLGPQFILTTHCCQSKSPLKEGTIRELYVDDPSQHRLEAFWKIVDDFKGIFEVGILSNLHGILLEDEVFENYDVSLAGADKALLGRKIAKKLPIDAEIIYYGYPPWRSASYCAILGYSGLHFYRFTNKDKVRQWIQRHLETQLCPKCTDDLEHCGEGCFACWTCEEDYKIRKGRLQFRKKQVKKVPMYDWEKV